MGAAEITLLTDLHLHHTTHAVGFYHVESSPSETGGNGGNCILYFRGEMKRDLCSSSMFEAVTFRLYSAASQHPKNWCALSGMRRLQWKYIVPHSIALRMQRIDSYFNGVHRTLQRVQTFSYGSLISTYIRRGGLGGRAAVVGLYLQTNGILRVEHTFRKLQLYLLTPIANHSHNLQLHNVREWPPYLVVVAIAFYSVCLKSQG
ncbi:hypothetical protein K440DRAFT_105709 [Wilcoxina mikolae CBS 423.85]|nr:hypothetical protein K440DRAFT_105709 [Wilcoxina mikolae CBS 423.85]